MVYSNKELNEDESIVLNLRPHWWFFSNQTFFLVTTLAIAGGVSWLWSPNNSVIELIAVVPFVISVVWFVLRYLEWVTTRFVLTTDRLVNRSGILRRQGIEIPLERVNTVFFSQTIFERIIGSGDLVIESAGEQGQQMFTDISKPLNVQNEIHHQMEANENRKFDRVVPSSSTASIPDQIDQLDQLRQRGILTEQEFQTKKKDLLGRL